MLIYECVKRRPVVQAIYRLTVWNPESVAFLSKHKAESPAKTKKKKITYDKHSHFV